MHMFFALKFKKNKIVFLTRKNLHMSCVLDDHKPLKKDATQWHPLKLKSIKMHDYHLLFQLWMFLELPTDSLSHHCVFTHEYFRSTP